MTVPVTAIYTSTVQRLQTIDALRGLIMIIMALDHVRDFFHAGAMSFQPEDLTRTTVALFFTRWITHLCAPVFAFTAGLGAYLWISRGQRDIGQLSQFLWKRGLWLVLLDVIVVRFAMFLSLTTGPVILSVLWVLGWSMVLLGLLIRLPVRVLAGISIAVIALHNLADPIQASALGSYSWIWNLLHQVGVIPIGGAVALIAYPLVPWFAVMVAGYCFGGITKMDAARRRTVLFRLGVTLTLAFVAIRSANIYGDPRPWSEQATPVLTLLSFLSTNKYPPSLSFLLMTLGPALIVWSLLDRLSLSRGNPLVVFGRVPLFFFIAHLFAIRLLTYPLAFVEYGTTEFLRTPLPTLGGSLEAYPPGFGYSLGLTYLIWFSIVAMLHPLCRWLAALKERRRDWWLSYI